MSPVDFLCSFRLDQAALLLKNKIGSVIDVAVEVGFNNRGYFTDSITDEIETVDTFQFGFTEKINAGYKATVGVEVNVGAFKGTGESEFSIGVELGANQTITTQTINRKSTTFSLNLEVDRLTAVKVDVVATKSTGRVLQKAKFIPHGYVFSRFSFDDKEEVDPDSHVYVDEIPEEKRLFCYDVEFFLDASVLYNYRVTVSPTSIVQDSKDSNKHIFKWE